MKYSIFPKKTSTINGYLRTTILLFCIIIVILYLICFFTDDFYESKYFPLLHNI